MRYISVAEVISLHRKVIDQSGGSHGIRDLAGLESAVAQPKQSFAGVDLHPTVLHKAAALGYSLISNHPFIDGNKRIGHASMEVFLILNGFEISASVDEQEKFILAVADGRSSRDGLHDWLRKNAVELKAP